MPLFFKAAFLLLNIHLLILQSNVNGERAAFTICKHNY